MCRPSRHGPSLAELPAVGVALLLLTSYASSLSCPTGCGVKGVYLYHPVAVQTTDALDRSICSSAAYLLGYPYYSLFTLQGKLTCRALQGCLDVSTSPNDPDAVSGFVSKCRRYTGCTTATPTCPRNCPRNTVCKGPAGSKQCCCASKLPLPIIFLGSFYGCKASSFRPALA